jgi:hypothetical protein
MDNTAGRGAVIIQVERKGENTYRVTVEEGGSRSRHDVTLKEDYHQRLTGGRIAAEELIRRSFEFLLARESKESILSSFDLTVIQRYFPDYERTVGGL